MSNSVNLLGRKCPYMPFLDRGANVRGEHVRGELTSRGYYIYTDQIRSQTFALRYLENIELLVK